MIPQVVTLRFVLVFLALATLSARAFDSIVVINELQYHPANELTETEWVELRSLQGVDVNLSNWALTGEVEFTFPEGTILPGGGYLVIAKTPGQITGAIGPFTGQLNNGGGTLRLVNQNGRIMDEVSYSDGGDWPTGPDGSGTTLSRRDASATSGPGAWTSSTELNGTPGGPNFYTGAAPVRTRVVAIGDTWKYDDSGNATPAGWQTTSFDDSTWKSGPTLITGGGAKLGGGAKPSTFANGLLAYWSFDETSGTVADNAVAGKPDGTMTNGASFVVDPVRGRVAEFDGTDDRMEVIDSTTGLPSLVFMPSMTATNDFTWAAWVWSSVGSTLTDQFGSVILGNRTDPNGADTTPREFIKIMPTAMQYHRNAATENLDYPDLATSTWTHMCVVKRGLNLDYYLNGTYVQTLPISGGLSNPLPFYVGGDRRASTAEHFQGRVDDVGLWTRALTAAEIAQLGGQYGPTPPLPSPPEQTTNAVTGTQPRYFRKTFTFNGSPGSASLELWPVADDGAVIYLNGTEIWRNNVPPTAEAGDAAFGAAPISIPNTALVRGTNVLSAEVHQFPGGNNDLLFGAELAITAIPGPAPASPPSLVFNEISGAADANFYIELRNTSGVAVDTTGWILKASTGQTISLPAQSVAAGGYVTLSVATLGFAPADGTRFFLIGPGGSELRDAREVTNRIRGLTSNGQWGHPTTATPGAANVVAVTDAIVINEIFYHGRGTSLEQWVELYNRSGAAVDIGGWKFSDGISYHFAPGTTIPAGGFVVVAWDPAAFATLHPGVTALGPFTGSLSGKGELLRLRDAADNVTDEVSYFDSGRWPAFADGGGSSLELRDPNADNSVAEAWAASDESAFGTWKTFTYTGSGANIGTDPTNYNEFVMGLLDAGEVLVDDVSVREDPAGANRELIQNGTFDSGATTAWRIIGNHRRSSVVSDPDDAGNKVLRLVASGVTEHMHNHAETTLKSAGVYVTIDPAKIYRISFRARWLRGSNLLHSRLWFNRLAATSQLPAPVTGGTPGAPNRSRVNNIGPTFSTLGHTPTVPAVGTPATVSVRVADPDGVTSVELFRSVNGGGWSSSPMSSDGNGLYTATVPAQGGGAKVQFYVRATDGLGAQSFFPAAGASSRAIIPWNDGQAQMVLASGARPHNLRVVMTPVDAAFLHTDINLMSNEELPCTVIFDEQTAYYGAAVRLKSSEHGRPSDARLGYVLSFGRDEPFLGAHTSISVDRSGGVTSNQYEILVKQVMNHSRGIIATEDDIIRVIGTKTGIVGPAILSKSRFDSEYLDGQWDNGGDGTLFKYELIYVQTQTNNGSPEGFKIPQEGPEHPGVNIGTLGSSKELYRWHYLIKNNHDRDDYAPLIPALNALGQSGAAFISQTPPLVDVNGYLRALSVPTLFGVIDNYATNSQHNALFYFPPGGKMTYIPWDLDYLNQTNATAAITGNPELSKWLLSPVYKRAFWSNVRDVLNTSFNTTFLTRWANHYSRFGVDMNSSLSYLTSRASYAASQVTANIPQVPFRITTPSPLTVNTPFATIVGDGWVDITTIRLSGSTRPLAVTWTDDNSWTAQLPVQAGTNTYTLTAHNSQGVQIGTASITVTGAGGTFPAGPGSLVVSELNYNPPGNTDATEFIELLNITAATLDLSGCHFDEELGQGISYTFPSGVQLAPGARLLVVRDTAAFNAQYGAGLPLAPGVFTGALDNSGETIVLYAASGLEIFRFTYTDDIGAADGNGKSLVRVLSSTSPNPNDYTWRASTQNGGNPNANDSVPFSGAPLADTDGDGFPALLEYAFGTSDTDAASRPPSPQIKFFADGTVTATYPTAPNADDIIAAPQTATSLSGPWQPLTAPVPAGSNRFFRLNVMLR